MNIGIVGHGFVGKHLKKQFSLGKQKVHIFDKYDSMYSSVSHKQQINRCDLVFVAVPTPSLPAGECDLTEVKEAVEWIDRTICLKSTIPPGTTDALVSESGKDIVFSPEYIGETPFHLYSGQRLPDVVAVGGRYDICSFVVDAYRLVLGPEPHYFVTTAITAELAKYMENCFFATKLAFVAQFYALSRHFDADFTQLREIWVADSRVGRSHSTVVGKPGFGGKCLPKDLAALIATAQGAGVDAGLLESVKLFLMTKSAISRSLD